jgi:hypothetical protein
MPKRDPARIPFFEIEAINRKLRGQAPEEGPKPEGVCQVCKTKTLVPTLQSEPFTMSTPIGGPPRPKVQDGWHCTKCGIRSRFSLTKN